MATRKKYKIVLSEKYVSKSENGKEWFQFPVNISGQLVAIQTIIPLDPYTEPDLKQVRKEAYEQGYYIGYSKYLNKSYEDGLKDAWEAARTLWNTPNRKEIFGHTTFNTVLTTLTAQETIEKIRQYEQEKEMDGLRQNIQTIVDQCGYSLDEIASVLQKMKES